jgi:dynein heavy chain
MWRSYNTW